MFRKEKTEKMRKRKVVQRAIPTHQEIKLNELAPLLARIYASRGVASAQELDNSVQQLPSYHSLLGIDKAASAIGSSIMANKSIVVVGDYDADGATSTAVAIQAMRLFGATRAQYLLPNRFEYGYGLTPEIVAVAKNLFKPDLIITVDNGISSCEGVAYANVNQISVVITDHHLPGDTLPDATAIVNPNQPGDRFPSKHLAGVGVIFYVMLAVRTYLREAGWFDTRNEPNLAKLLDLVALGTVADVVTLDHTNRILVKQGLARIQARECSPGILALLAVANRFPEKLVASDLGFSIGPRLNAAGRLEDMSIGVACLLSDNFETALSYAQELDNLNASRKEIESVMQEQALSLLDKLPSQLVGKEEQLPWGIALFNEEWHQGVIGILASRIKERVHRPVICFAKAQDQETLKGSARSIPGVHIRDVLDAMAKKHPSLIQKFGGHAMAAGLSIAKKDFETFAKCFSAQVHEMTDNTLFTEEILTDGSLTDEELSLDLAKELRAAGPWGQSFPEPLFEGIFDIQEKRVVGEKHLKMRLKSHQSGKEVDAIAFHVPKEQLKQELKTIHCAYRLSVNDFNQSQSLQLMIVSML